MFAFDLDGTVTMREILPAIGASAGIGEELAELTALTLTGKIEFTESFRRRFQMLRRISLRQIETVVSAIPLNPHIEDFIRTHRKQCVIVTGNLDRWVRPLIKRLGCACYCSRSAFTRKNGLELVSVLDKGSAIRAHAARHPDKRRIIAIGESVNDLPMFQYSDVAIAFAGVHTPAAELMRTANYVAYDGEDLCRLLYQLMKQ